MIDDLDLLVHVNLTQFSFGRSVICWNRLGSDLKNRPSVPVGQNTWSTLIYLS